MSTRCRRLNHPPAYRVLASGRRAYCGVSLASLAVAVVAFAAFVRAGLRSPDLMLDLRLRKSASTSAVMSAATATMFGSQVTLTAGLVLLAAGAFALLAIGPDSGFGDMWPGLVLAGLGTGLQVAPSTAAAVNSVPHLQAGMASAAWGCWSAASPCGSGQSRRASSSGAGSRRRASHP